ncbi:hypothetical protein As57867_025303, partial [Aphanomyces stellatus]
RLIDCDSGQLIQCRSVTFTEDSVPANDKKVQFNDQITTVPLQDYPSENVEVEDRRLGAPIVDTDRDPSVSSQPSEGQVSDTDHEEHVSSDQESSDSDVEPENPTGLEAISGGRHQVLSVDTVNDAPQSFADIEASPNKQAWLDATHEEYDALVNNGTWVLTELPAGRKALACKWLWRNKFDAVGHCTKYKARLVIKGFMQRCGLDYVEIFAPVLRYNTLRLVLFLVASNGWIIRQMDVKTAFLNGYLDEDTEIYMVQPPNFAVPGMEHLVCKLLKVINGLKQAPRCWCLTLHELLVRISFERCIKEVCLYIKRVGDSMVLLTVYVDDITITGNDNQEIEKACDALKERFEMTDLGTLKSILGIQVEIEDKVVTMSQQGYVEQLLEKFNMVDSNPVATPEVVGQVLEPSKLSPSEMKTLNLPYRELVGSLQYLVTCTRPDIANAVRNLSKYLSCFDESHWKQAKRVLRYLKGTNSLCLKIDRTNQVGAFQIEAYCDADFANSCEDRRSISGFLVMFLGSCLSARSRKQTMVTLSTAEAEYIALCDLVKELLWYSELLVK